MSNTFTVTTSTSWFSRIKNSVVGVLIGLVLLVGGRLGELPSQSYTLLDIPRPQMPLVHVHAGAEELGRVYRPTLAINASPDAFAHAFAAAMKSDSPERFVKIIRLPTWQSKTSSKSASTPTTLPF